MINYVMIGTNRFEAAVAFYDALMSEMGATRAYATEKNVGWGWGIGTPMLIVTRPYDQRQATIGKRLHGGLRRGDARVGGCAAFQGPGARGNQRG